MNPKRADIFGCCQIHIVIYGTFPGVKSCYQTYIFIGESKVEYVKIFNHPLMMHSLGNYDYIALIEPAEYNLTD